MSRPVQHAPESRVRPALADSHIPGLGLGISVPKETQTLKRVSERSAADVQHGSTPFERAPMRTNGSSRLAPARADAHADAHAHTHPHSHAPTMPSLATSDRIVINDVLEQYKPGEDSMVDTSHSLLQNPALSHAPSRTNLAPPITAFLGNPSVGMGSQWVHEDVSLSAYIRDENTTQEDPRMRTGTTTTGARPDASSVADAAAFTNATSEPSTHVSAPAHVSAAGHASERAAPSRDTSLHQPDEASEQDAQRPTNMPTTSRVHVVETTRSSPTKKAPDMRSVYDSLPTPRTNEIFPDGLFTSVVTPVLDQSSASERPARVPDDFLTTTNESISREPLLDRADLDKFLLAGDDENALFIKLDERAPNEGEQLNAEPEQTVSKANDREPVPEGVNASMSYHPQTRSLNEEDVKQDESGPEPDGEKGPEEANDVDALLAQEESVTHESEEDEVDRLLHEDVAMDAGTGMARSSTMRRIVPTKTDDIPRMPKSSSPQLLSVDLPTLPSWSPITFDDLLPDAADEPEPPKRAKEMPARTLVQPHISRDQIRARVEQRKTGVRKDSSLAPVATTSTSESSPTPRTGTSTRLDRSSGAAAVAGPGSNTATGLGFYPHPDPRTSAGSGTGSRVMPDTALGHSTPAPPLKTNLRGMGARARVSKHHDVRSSVEAARPPMTSVLSDALPRSSVNSPRTDTSPRAEPVDLPRKDALPPAEGHQRVAAEARSPGLTPRRSNVPRATVLPTKEVPRLSRISVQSPIKERPRAPRDGSAVNVTKTESTNTPEPSAEHKPTLADSTSAAKGRPHQTLAAGAPAATGATTASASASASAPARHQVSALDSPLTKFQSDLRDFAHLAPAADYGGQVPTNLSNDLARQATWFGDASHADGGPEAVDADAGAHLAGASDQGREHGPSDLYDQRSSRATQITQEADDEHASSSTPSPGAPPTAFSFLMERELQRIVRESDQKYKIRERGVFVDAPRQAATEPGAHRAWKRVQKPNEVSALAAQQGKPMSHSVPDANGMYTAGRIFFAIDSFTPTTIYAQDEASVYCVLDNGIHRVKTVSVPLLRPEDGASPIDQEFELLESPDFALTVTLMLDGDSNVVEVPMEMGGLPSSSEPRTSVGRFLSRHLGGTRDATARRFKGSGSVLGDKPFTFPRSNELGQIHFTLRDVRHQCYGRCFAMHLPVQVDTDSRATIMRRGHGAGSSTGAPAGRLVRGMLRIRLFYLPPLPQALEPSLPGNMQEAAQGMDSVSWHQTMTSYHGVLTQLGGDCISWRRRPMRIIGLNLVCYNEVTKRPTTRIDLVQAVSVDECGPTTSHPDDSYNVPRSFCLSFRDGEKIYLFADTEESMRDWMRVLRNIIAHKLEPPPAWAVAASYAVQASVHSAQRRSASGAHAPSARASTSTSAPGSAPASASASTTASPAPTTSPLPTPSHGLPGVSSSVRPQTHTHKHTRREPRMSEDHPPSSKAGLYDRKSAAQPAHPSRPRAPLPARQPAPTYAASSSPRTTSLSASPEAPEPPSKSATPQTTSPPLPSVHPHESKGKRLRNVASRWLGRGPRKA